MRSLIDQVTKVSFKSDDSYKHKSKEPPSSHLVGWHWWFFCVPTI